MSAPNATNLYHFKVQGVSVEGELSKVWLTRSTAKYLELLLGALDASEVSKAIGNYIPSTHNNETESNFSSAEVHIVVPLLIREQSYEKLRTLFSPIIDEYMFQQLAINLGESK